MLKAIVLVVIFVINHVIMMLLPEIIKLVRYGTIEDDKLESILNKALHNYNTIIDKQQKIIK